MNERIDLEMARAIVRKLEALQPTLGTGVPVKTQCEAQEPYKVQVDEHSDDCGTVYLLKGPNVGILDKDEELLKYRAEDFNLGYAQGQASKEARVKKLEERWEKLKHEVQQNAEWEHESGNTQALLAWNTVADLIIELEKLP